MTTPHEIALLRLVAQRIANPPPATPTDTVRWLTAAQAQDFPGALTSIALRSAGGTRQAVHAALDAGEIVRSWPMRGTLHLLVAEDLPWVLGLTASRTLARAAGRQAQLGLDPATLVRARDLAVEALVGGHRLRRDELLAVWNTAGLGTDAQRGYHLIWHLAQTGTLCFGPMADGEQQIVLVDEWIPQPRRPDREEALGELAARYFRGHGPATTRDFTRWANLVAADVRVGLALARPTLARIEVDGVEYLMDPLTPELLDTDRARAGGVFLLPGFDEFILGYQDRSAVLPAEFADRIVPGNNGMFRPTVIADGRVLGTWTRNRRGADQGVVATPFRDFPPDVLDAIPLTYARLPMPE
ncbi:winged helix DNA-binding protein [Micromonospora pisi]|uniref:Winged helix DNA-binding protein n=1 Tax=Micromonospora pisi TaxID=589240 RepID=A0A495JD16_9ACTN|nr:winged helix DNA-binding domain-containing protein [Micromonospora pisi]RKR86254.1 winged helix DNA-binding protein [Micromonospora pisi]